MSLPASRRSLAINDFLFCVFLLLSAACSSAAQKDPASGRLLLDAALSGDAILAVGERGTVLRSEDHGRSWQRAKAPDTATLTGVAFAPNGIEGWAVGHGAVILATKDNGRTWTKAFQGPKPDQSFLDIAVLDSKRIMAVGAYGFAMLSNDGGTSWHPFAPQDADLHYNRIVSLGTDALWIVGEQGTLLQSSDGGQSWKRSPLGYDGSLFGFFKAGNGALFCFGLRGHAFLSDASVPTSWMPLKTGTTGLIATGLQLKDGTLVFAGQSRLFLISNDGGRTLQHWDTGLTTAVAELLEAKNGALLAIGEAGVTQLPPLPARNEAKSN